MRLCLCSLRHPRAGAGLCAWAWSAGGHAHAAARGSGGQDLGCLGQGLLRAKHRPKGPGALREASILCGGIAGRQISEGTGASRCHGARWLGQGTKVEMYSSFVGGDY